MNNKTYTDEEILELPEFKKKWQPSELNKFKSLGLHYKNAINTSIDKLEITREMEKRYIAFKGKAEMFSSIGKVNVYDLALLYLEAKSILKYITCEKRKKYIKQVMRILENNKSVMNAYEVM